MPIYAYRCDSCGAEKDVLQKFSDAPLSVCPQCGAEAFRKVLTAPAFQLKGSGWYVTDFRDGNKAKPDTARSAEPASAEGTGSGGGGNGEPAAAAGKADAGKGDAGKASAGKASAGKAGAGKAGAGGADAPAAKPREASPGSPTASGPQGGSGN